MSFIGPNDITVVILTYRNTDHALETALHVCKSVNRVIITSDGGPNITQTLPGNVEFIWQPDNGNMAATARNNGLARVRTSGVVMFDDDCLPHPYCVQSHGICLNMYDVSYGLVCQQPWNVTSDSRMLMFIRDRSFLWRYGWTGNMAMRMSVYRNVISHYKNGVGCIGFDPLYNGSHGFEDLDYAYACYREGIGTMLNPLAMVHHLNNHSVTDFTGEANYKKFVDKWGVTP